MKKVTSLTVMLFCILLSSTVLASNYPTYLNNNRNYIFCGGHQGVGWYVDRTSLVVQEYNPPHYIIAVNVVIASLSSDGFQLDRVNSPIINKVETRYYYYNWDERKMYRLNNKDNKYHYIPPVGSLAETGHEFSGELAFYIAYRTKFYGGRQYYDSSTGRYENVNFSDSLYANVVF